MVVGKQSQAIDLSAGGLELCNDLGVLGDVSASYDSNGEDSKKGQEKEAMVLVLGGKIHAGLSRG